MGKKSLPLYVCGAPSTRGAEPATGLASPAANITMAAALAVIRIVRFIGFSPCAFLALAAV
jgi:hypothetical protein